MLRCCPQERRQAPEIHSQPPAPRRVGVKREGMEPGLEAVLGCAKRTQLTTWGPAGRPGTVPVWFMVKDGRLYFTTLKGSLKAIAAKVTLAIRASVTNRINWLQITRPPVTLSPARRVPQWWLREGESPRARR